MRPDLILQRAQQLVDRRRLLIGLCAAVALALVAAIPGLRGGGGERSLRTAAAPTTRADQATPTVDPTAGIPDAAFPSATTVPPPTSTTTPASVLGTSITRPGAAPPTTLARLQGQAPQATTTTAIACRNSYDPKCGPFRWDPQPGPNRPLEVTLHVSPETPHAGEQVTVRAVVTDPDDPTALYCSASTYDYGDGPSMSTHCDPPAGGDPCPKRYGPWTPPAPSQGGGAEDWRHTYTVPGTYTITFSYSPGQRDACYNPYASAGSGSTKVTVTAA